MMRYAKRTILFFCLALLGMSCKTRAQLPGHLPHSQDPKFDKTIVNTLSFSVPVISVDDLKADPDRFVILDAREKNEYEVSRIPGSRWIGYDDFSMERMRGIDKKTPVLLYCSIGYRSEKVGEKLRAEGFEQVYNLYGSIFEWANRGFPLVDETGQTVRRVHAYNAQWGRWVDGDKNDKVY